MAKIQLYFKGGTGAPQVLEVEEKLAERLVKENPAFEYYGKPKKDDVLEKKPKEDIVIEEELKEPKKSKKKW